MPPRPPPPSDGPPGRATSRSRPTPPGQPTPAKLGTAGCSPSRLPGRHYAGHHLSSRLVAHGIDVRGDPRRPQQHRRVRDTPGRPQQEHLPRNTRSNTPVRVKLHRPRGIRHLRIRALHRVRSFGSLPADRVVAPVGVGASFVRGQNCSPQEQKWTAARSPGQNISSGQGRCPVRQAWHIARITGAHRERDCSDGPRSSA
jgi:hypothetical protein